MRHARHRCAPGFAALPLDQQIELVVGPGPASAFASDEARRQTWRRHRAEVLAREPPGQRPWAWWQYESGVSARRAR